MSERNQAARSNCSSSRRCHRSAHRGSTWFLLSRCKDRNYFSKMQVFERFSKFNHQKLLLALFLASLGLFFLAARFSVFFLAAGLSLFLFAAGLSLFLFAASLSLFLFAASLSLFLLAAFFLVLVALMILSAGICCSAHHRHDHHGTEQNLFHIVSVINVINRLQR